jgi:hypothetical protein
MTKTKKQQALEDKQNDPYYQLAQQLVEKMSLSSYEILDYSGCYYEGDTPSIDTDHLRNELMEALRALGVSNSR